MSLNLGRNIPLSALLACLLWLLAMVDGVRPAVAQEWDSMRVPWDALLFEASSPLGRIAAQIELGSPTKEDPKLEPGSDSQGPVLLPGREKVLLLTAGIDASLLLQRKQWSGRVWFLAEQGSALQRIRVKLGKKGSFKLFRYARDGVYRKRIEPKGEKEASLPPQEWSKVKDTVYPYTTDRTRCERVLDPLTLLYVVSATDWSAQSELEFCLFNKQGLYLARLDKAGGERLKTAFMQQRGESISAAVEREVDAWRIQLTSRPLDPGSKDLDPFEFLGFEGEVQILLEAESGIPLRLTGEIPSVGPVELNLAKAGLVR